MEEKYKKLSKFLSFLLRHKPESIGLTLDHNGWASIPELLEKSDNPTLTRDVLEIIVETNDKQRFSIEGDRIRANQGHSIEVNLELPASEPPNILLHGTASRFLPDIMEQGISKMNRHHVHLTEKESVAKAVGSRYGKVVILEIMSQEMRSSGFEFFQTANNVWLVNHVPPQFIKAKIKDKP